MDLSDQLRTIIRAACRKLPDDDINVVINHLITKVKVQDTDDLRDVDEKMLAEVPSLGSLDINRLIKAFNSVEPAPAANSGTQMASVTLDSSSHSSVAGSSSGPSNSGVPSLERDRSTVMRDPSYFTYTVDFTSLPESLVKPLEQAKNQNVAAKESDTCALKLAISKKVKSAYRSHRVHYPNAQVHPGRRIYDSLAKQMANKFGRAVKQVINGKEVGDGERALSKQFEHCIQNQRTDPEDEGPRPSRSRPLKGKTTIGVLVDRYCPAIVDKKGQEAIKETMSAWEKMGWNEEDVKTDLQKCFSLIRDDIVKLTEEINRQVKAMANANPPENVDDEMEVDSPDLPGIVVLKKEWPFLFYPFGLLHHHSHLTGGRDLQTPLNKFANTNRLFFFASFMVCSSSARLENLALRVRVEGHHGMDSADKTFLMSLLMLANHFKEDINLFIIPAEKTTSTDALQMTILKDLRDPCIVAMDHKLFSASTYYVCSDRVPIIQTNSAMDAFLCLVMACFVFDLDYPKLPLTMEFLERYVLGLGFLDTRIMKRGKQVVVLTDKVASLIKDFETFEEKFHESMEKVPYV